MSNYYVSVTDTAKLIRAALRREFPGIKFSVRSRSYAGGASIDVCWTDGPQKAAVEEVTGSYAGAGFDGMTDCKTMTSRWLYPDGHTELAQASIGHSYGSQVYDTGGEQVSPEDARDYGLGLRHGAGITNTIDPPDGLTPAFQRGLADGRKLHEAGARLVHFGADFVFANREFSDGYRHSLEQAVLTLSGESGPFDGNRRYEFGIDGRVFSNYGSTLVWQISQVDPGVLAAAVKREQDRQQAVARVDARGSDPQAVAEAEGDFGPGAPFSEPGFYDQRIPQAVSATPPATEVDYERALEITRDLRRLLGGGS